MAAERDFVRAVELARGLCDELGLHPLAAAPCALATRLAEDPDARREVEARALLDEALELVKRRGLDRARGRLEALVRDYPETRAADVARGRLSAR
jgi:GNAT superfamily N-acetyltransferase